MAWRSGAHINPAVTLGLAVAGKTPWNQVPVYVAAQLIGAFIGAVLCWARALGEFGATITFVSNIPGETQTLPLAIYAATQVPGGEGTAGKLAAVSLALALGGLLLSELIARRMHRLLG